MIVVLRTFEILAVFSLLGLPVNLLLLPRAMEGRKSLHVSTRLLLAPATGLAVIATLTAVFYATMRPVAVAVPFFWPLVAGLWLVVAVRYFPVRSSRPPGRLNPIWRGLMAYGFVACGLLPVLACYLWPFIHQPDLVFWHYAGSDGYFYIRIAEHVAFPGTGVIPTIGPYDASSGFMAAELRLFHAGGFADKPGTMSTLGGVATLLQLTTHETFSPLVAATLTTLYLVLLCFGRSLMRLPVWASVGFAVLGTLAPPVWMLSGHTFLGNVLALPLYPLIMLMVRPFGTWRAAVYLGLLLAAQMVVFPDGTLALAGMLVLAILFHLWTTCRRRRVRRFLASGFIAIGTTSLLVAPFGLVVYITAFWRLRQVLFTRSPSSLFKGTHSLLEATAQAGIKPLVKLDWIWGAFNLNTIPPQPLKAGEVPYLYGLAAGLVLFVLASIGRRHLMRLFPYLIGFLLLLAVGLAGLLQSDYELFRALAVFAFVPLAALCGMPWEVAGHSAAWRPLVLRFALLAALAPLLVHFVRNDWYHFKLGYDDHASDAQYTTGNLRDRTAITHLAESNSMVLASETASFTAFANVLVLFSEGKLGVPACFNRFIYFGEGGSKEAPYASALVLRNLRYDDITERPPGRPKVYASRDFEVVANDLEPFFDNDTLPLVNGFPAEFLKKRQLSLARTLGPRTVINFYSQQDRSALIELRFGPGDVPVELPYAFDEDSFRNAAVDRAGRVILPTVILRRGLHQLVLGPLARPAQVTAFHIYANGEDLEPALLRGRWYESKDLQSRQLAPFRFMSPAPSSFFSDIGPACYGEFYFAHPLTRLRFRIPPGHRVLRTVARLDPSAYEQVAPADATDGIELEVAVLTADGRRSVVLDRTVDPVQHSSDRGLLPVEVACEVPPGGEIEVTVGPGNAGRYNRDWFYLGPLTIR